MSEDVIDSGLIDVRDLSLDALVLEGGGTGLQRALERILADNPDQSTGFQSSI